MHSQINPEGENLSNYIHLNDPHPPSSRPPVTPRTPRTPRRNGFLLHERSEGNQKSDESTKHLGSSQSRSSPAGRSGGPPQKRSPSAPMDEDEDTIADHGVELEASTGSKRMKSEIKVIDIHL